VYQPNLKYTLKFFQSCTSRPRFFITPLYISLRCTFVPVPVKGLYQTKEYSLHVMQLIRIYATWGYFCFSHVKRGVSLLRMWNINCNPHWRATQLTIKLGIYQVRYTCYLYCIFFLERLFRADVARKGKKNRVKYHLLIKRMCAVVEFFSLIT